MQAIITAYCACHLCCGSAAIGITASGTRLIQGLTCAAPRHIPFGTWCHIPNIGWRRVEDRTARRYEGRIDIYFRKHADAKKFGITTNTVTYHKP